MTRKEPNIDAATVLTAKSNSKAVPSESRQEELNWQQWISPIAKAATVGMLVIAAKKCTFPVQSTPAPSQNVESHFSALMGWPSAPWSVVQWMKSSQSRCR